MDTVRHLLLVPDAYLGRTPPLAYLRRLDAHTMDLSVLPAERRRFLAGIGRRLTGPATTAGSACWTRA